MRSLGSQGENQGGEWHGLAPSLRRSSGKHPTFVGELQIKHDNLVDFGARVAETQQITWNSNFNLIL
jgi:hypothetical protein